MKASVQAFLSSCQVCHQAKPDRAKYPGLLQPLLVPEEAWHTISMDFVEGLPKSAGMNAIFGGG
jgi:mono/diheme cytochrome c family protein